MITAKTRVFGVIGWPIAHSRSPRMHGEALRELDEDAVYVAFAVRPEELEHAVHGMRALGIAGMNVTIPHKETIASLLDEVDGEARAIGAVNTIVRDGDRLLGTNTDAQGLVRSLRESGVDAKGMHVLVLGSGGAARAAVHGLRNAGATVQIAARRLDRAQAIGDAIEMSAIASIAPSIDLLVQATSATLGGGDEAERFVSSLALHAFRRETAVVDLVYSPLETALLREARARGMNAIDGLGMLIGQAALSLERWLGKPAPMEALRRGAHAT